MSTGDIRPERCSGLDVIEANAAACSRCWRPSKYEYWGIEPRPDFSHTLFGIKNGAVIGLRYYEADNTCHQYCDAELRAGSGRGEDGAGTYREHVGTDVEAQSYYA